MIGRSLTRKKKSTGGIIKCVFFFFKCPLRYPLNVNFKKKYTEMADVPIGSFSGCQRDHYKNLNNFFITEQIFKI